MPDGKKKRRVLHVPDGDGSLLTALLTSDDHEVTEADGTSPVLDLTALEQIDLVVVERPAPAEAALHGIMARHRALLDATPDMVFLLTGDGTFLDHHAKDPGQLLAPPERFLGKNVRDVLPPGLAADLLNCFGRALASGAPVTHGYTLPSADGPRAYEATVVGCGEHKVMSIVRDVTERRRAEDAVMERDRLLHTIFDSLSSHVAVLDREGVITYVSRSWEEFAGRNQGLPGRIGVGVNYLGVCRAAQTGDPAAREVIEGIEAVMAGERPTFSIEYPCHSPAERRWFMMQVDPLPPEQGGVVISHTNITERKRAEAELAESHRRTSEILESIGDAFYSLDKDFNFTYVNREAERLWGVRREDLLGRNFLKVFPQAVGTPSYHRIMRAVEDGRMVAYEAISPIINRWVETSVYPTEAGLSIYFRDITERKRAEEALRESEKRFRATFEQAAVGVAHSSPDGRLLLMNRRLCDILGYSAEELLAKTYQEVTHPEDLVAELEYARRLLAGEIEHASYEKRYIRKDGSTVWVNLTASVVRDESTGEPLYFVAVVEDIGARKAAEEALGESEEFNRRIVESSGDCIKLLDPEGRLLYISERGQELLGIEDVGPYLNGSWVGLWPGEGQRDARAAIEAAKAGGVGTFEAFGPTPRGEPKWWDTVITPMTDAGGRVTRLLAVSRDISESRRAAEALRSALEEVRQLKDRLQEENVYLREEAKLERHFGEIVGRSDAIKYVLHKIEQVAPTGTNVLITGETGTGKELVARAIHSESPRRARPLVKVNCAALTPTLIESELFGHEKGAFTGAVGRKVGRFELADGATLFLDEIGELPLELQAKLLRVLQDGEFERLGNAKTLRVDVRVIAATNRDLWKDVQAGRFRADLFYRLNVYPITVPPLRERRGDISPLVEHFAGVFSKKMGKEITSVAPATLDTLRSYLWPGNVRELANVIERAVITAPGPVLEISNLTEASPAGAPRKPGMTLEEVEREHITAVLESTNRKIDGPDGAAKILGLNPSTLRTRMNKLGIEGRKP